MHFDEATQLLEMFLPTVIFIFNIDLEFTLGKFRVGAKELLALTKYNHSSVGKYASKYLEKKMLLAKQNM